MHNLTGHARDRCCTKPGCFVPGYDCEIHHAHDWSTGGPTNADNLYFGCATDHAAATNGTYTTTVTNEHRLAWTDGTQPPQINNVHHPERILNDDG